MDRQILAFFIAFLGFKGTILIVALPMWKVTAFVGVNIVTAQVFWEGLWMNCVMQSTSQMQCKAYDSVLSLPQDLQVTRAMVCVSLAVALVAICLMVLGANCTNFIHEDHHDKIRVGIGAGVTFIIAGILSLIAISWSAYTTIVGFYNPLATTRKGELGACIYVGWLAGFLQLLGGGIFISTYSNSC